MEETKKEFTPRPERAERPQRVPSPSQGMRILRR